MHRLYLRILILGFVSQMVAGLWAGEYRLTNGDVLRGEPVSFNDEGVVIRLDIGGYTPRIGWTRLTQDALKEIAQNPQAQRFTEPFIEIPIEVKRKERAKKKEVILKEVPRVERPWGKEGKEEKGLAGFMTPVGLTLLGLFFLANLLAAYEVAVFRNRSPGLVCGLSVVLPVLAPVGVLALPARPEAGGAGEAAEELAAAGAGPAASLTSRVKEQAAASKEAGLSLSAGLALDKSTPAAEPSTYKRGEFTFNRRFFETKFPGFFRVVPSEAEKDLMMVIRTPKQEYVGKRISRISSNEVHLQLLRGGAEASVGFGEITEVQIRHKDTKA